MLLSFLALAPSVGRGRAEEFQRYCNGRFGFCVDYPMHFAMESEPVNGDGRRIHDAKGFLMIAAAINKVTDDNLESEMQSKTYDFDQITYRTQGENWFVLSGRKRVRILYYKTYISSEVFNHLSLKYPVSMKKEYNPIVTRISRSFVPGELDSTR